MEAPHSSVGPTESGKDIATIYREIATESEHYLAQRTPAAQTPYTDSSGFLLVDSPFLDSRPQTSQYFVSSPYGAPSALPSVASPPSVLSPVASPTSVSDCYPNTADAAIVCPVTEMSNGWLPSPAPAAACVAQLIITEQPVERCRFRYRAEHSPHGALRGADKRQKSCPKVKVENFKGRGYVLASLYTNEEIPRPHINELWGWSNNCAGGRCRVDLDANMSAVFPNLGIMRQKENDVCELLYRKYLKEHNDQGWTVTDDVKESLREKAQRETATMKDCMHCVRLGFQAFLFEEPNGREVSTPIVLSSPIFNSQNTGYSELKIAEIDKSCGHAVGGDRIWLRCAAKIRRDQIKIVFHDPNTRWEAEGVFSASDVYEQILIIFKTPAYRDVNITERVHVNLHLLRTSDNTYSPAVDFVYLPLDDGPSAKRPRRTVPAYGPSGFGYFPDETRSSTESGASQAGYGSATEFDAYMPGGGGTTGIGRQHQRRPQHGRTSIAHVPHDLDSGIVLDRASLSSEAGPSMTSLTDVRSRIEHMSLAELNRIGAVGEAAKLQNYLTGLWDTHVRALWSFSAEGDPEPFVQACKGLIGLQDENGNTAIHTAVKNKQSFALKTMLKVLDTLPNKQQIIDERNFKKQTALHMAIRYGDDDCVHYLITAGADRTAIDAEGQTVAHYLAETFNEDIYRDILFPPNETTASRQKVDLAVMNDEGDTAVHLAVKRKKLALLESLLEAEASVNDVERNTGKSALHLAVEAGDTEAVELLLQNRIAVNLQTYDGTTALQLAAKMKLAPAVAKLIAAGADPNEKTSSMALAAVVKASSGEVAASAEGEDEAEEEVLGGEGAELHSAFDFACDDQLIIDILKGKPYTAPTPPCQSPSAMSQGSISGDNVPDAVVSIAVGGARPKTSPYMPAASSKQSLAPPGSSPGRRSPMAAAADDDDDLGITMVPLAARRLLSSRSSSGSPERLPAGIIDDLSSLDYVTRIRLSKLLDEGGKWEIVARSLGCEHMIDFLKVCAEADNSSPTVLLLDQLEHSPGSSVTGLVNALREGGHRQAVDMIIRKQKQQQQQQQGSSATGGDESAGADV